MGWRGNGIEVAGSGKTVRKNQLSLNGVGIKADGVNTVTYNVATGNGVGVKLLGATTATRNATSGNMIGFEVMDGFTGTVEENNRASRHEGLPHLGPDHAVARSRRAAAIHFAAATMNRRRISWRRGTVVVSAA